MQIMLSIYLKPTNYCNIDCDHCYLPEETRANKAVMSDQTLTSTVKLAKDLALREGHDEVHFIWHGGEPLVLSPGYYWHAQEVLCDAMGGFTYSQSLQTSLIPYRQEWSQLIAEVFNCHIGSSVDFTQRHVKSSPEAYLDLWMGKVELARSHGHFVHPGMVPTRHEASKAKPIYQWFVEHGFKAFNIERYSQFGGKLIDWPTNHEHARFLTGLFDCVVEDLRIKGHAPAINVVIGGIRGVIEGIASDRWGTRCQREFVVVEPDGSMNTCPDRARHEQPYSNTQDGVDAFISSPQRRNWIRVNDITHKENHCHACEFNGFCKSGCPVTPNGPANGQKECSGYKTYLLHVQSFTEKNPELVPLLLRYASMQASDIGMSILEHE
jgi:radical SAM protein with 4Fe4S-binding SPASM domain